MIPKDLTPKIIETLKKTALDYPAGSVPTDFDPNKFVFHGNTGLTVMLTTDSSGGEKCWHMSLSYTQRAPSDDEARAVLSAFFNSASDKAGRLIMPEGANQNVVHYRLPV